MITPEAIAAVAAAALLLGLAMASGTRGGKEGAQRCGGWRPSAAHEIVEPRERLEQGSYTARRRAPRPVITERQAREHYAMGEQFSSDAMSEIRQWNAEQRLPNGRNR